MCELALELTNEFNSNRGTLPMEWYLPNYSDNSIDEIGYS